MVHRSWERIALAVLVVVVVYGLAVAYLLSLLLFETNLKFGAEGRSVLALTEPILPTFTPM